MEEKSGKSEAKIKFNIKSKEFEISGSEDFVNGQVENFKGLIQESLAKIALDVPQKLAVGNQYNFLPPKHETIQGDVEDVHFEESAPNSNQANDESFENVIVIDGDRVKVIADVPGNTTAKKSVKVVLLYLWGKQRIGVDEVPFTELRDMCQEYGELDKANFSTTMNNQKKLFLINGSGKSQTAKLIRPGVKMAEQLLKELNE